MLKLKIGIIFYIVVLRSYKPKVIMKQVLINIFPKILVSVMYLILDLILKKENLLELYYTIMKKYTKKIHII